MGRGVNGRELGTDRGGTVGHFNKEIIIGIGTGRMMTFWLGMPAMEGMH